MRMPSTRKTEAQIILYTNGSVTGGTSAGAAKVDMEGDPADPLSPTRP